MITTKQGRYIVIDTETTGLNPTKHGLIELAAVAMDKKFAIIDQYCIDVCPPKDTPVEPKSLKINGFTLDRIANGSTYQETAETFLHFIEKNFDQKPTLIGQFLPFDYTVLDNLFTSTKTEDWAAKIFMSNKFIDTKALSMALNLRAEIKGVNLPFPSTSLNNPGGLKDLFKIEGLQAHSAMGDVLATREVFIRLMEIIEYTNPKDVFC